MPSMWQFSKIHITTYLRRRLGPRGQCSYGTSEKELVTERCSVFVVVTPGVSAG